MEEKKKVSWYFNLIINIIFSLILCLLYKLIRYGDSFLEKLCIFIDLKRKKKKKKGLWIFFIKFMII